MHWNMADIWELNLQECSLANVAASSRRVVNVLSESNENLITATGFRA